MRGQMLMYGAHARRAAGASEKVPECAEKWPDRYNPNGKSGTDAINAATAAVDAHTAALTTLEVDLLPEAAAARRLLAAELDPNARFRVVESSSESTGFSLSLTQGYVVSPHDDSGMALEMIGFVWPSDAPLPTGHEWLFCVAGCIHPLPTKKGEMVVCAVRGSGVGHGTLPTSRTFTILGSAPRWSLSVISSMCWPRANQMPRGRRASNLRTKRRQ